MIMSVSKMTMLLIIFDLMCQKPNNVTITKKQ